MTLLAQNGWTANNRALIAGYTVPGTNLRISLRMGDASVILLDWLGFWHNVIEDLHHTPQDLWGYAEKKITGGGSSAPLSNHAAGMAADARATAHPQGTAPERNFSAGQLALIRARVDLYNRVGGSGTFRWGGDYVSAKKDGMHGEVIGSAAQVSRLASAIRQNTLGAVVYLVGQEPVKPGPQVAPATGDVLRNGSSGDEVRGRQQELVTMGLRVGNSFGYDACDGVFGDWTERAVRAFQIIRGLAVDGMIGDQTRAAMDSLNHAGIRLLAEDGDLGPATTAYLQNLLGVTVDGDLGEETIRAWQQREGTAVDGVISAVSTLIKAVQKRYGLPAGHRDGKLGPETITALQRAINDRRF